MSDVKKLERPRTGRMVAGVCAAIANYFNLDATVVRVIYIIATISTVFSGVIIYFILTLLIPEKKKKFNINR